MIRPIAEHFDRSEFRCPCGCGLDTVDTDLMFMLNAVRERFGVPVIVLSGCRCAQYNADLPGAAPDSQHVYCRAADIVVQGVPAQEVQAFIDEELVPGGLGRYEDYTHVDSRDGYARWAG